MSTQTTPAQSRAKIAVCGEINSGKTSVLNALYRDGMIPDFSDAPKKPAIKIVFGSDTVSLQYTTQDDADVSVQSLDKLPMDGTVKTVEIHTQDDRLPGFELVEFPALREGKVTEKELEQIAGCDALIWMTIGSQAWRLSEKTIVEKISGRLPEMSILAVSRADKVRSATDKNRLTTRLKKETKGYFDHHVMMCAEPTKLAAAKADSEAWRDIGGEALSDCLRGLFPENEKPASETSVAAQSMEHEEAPAEFKRPKRSAARMKGIVKIVENRVAKKDTDDNSAGQSETESVQQKAETKLSDQTDTTVEAADTTPDEPHFLGGTEATEAKIAEIARGLDGFQTLVEFSCNSPDDIRLVEGDKEKGSELASALAESAKLLAETDVFEHPEWVHLSLGGHQLLYRLNNRGEKTLAMSCQSSNAGLVRNAFLRMLKTEKEQALESA